VPNSQTSVLSSSTPTIAKRALVSLLGVWFEPGLRVFSGLSGLINVVIIRSDMPEQIDCFERFLGRFDF
jgi:hypothetical protein